MRYIGFSLIEEDLIFSVIIIELEVSCIKFGDEIFFLVLDVLFMFPDVLIDIHFELRMDIFKFSWILFDYFL